MKLPSFERVFQAAMFLSALCASSPAMAISEADYAANYRKVVVPFLETGVTYDFKTRDGSHLNGVRFNRPFAKGAIVVVPGRTEPWLKYAEVFYDLYQRGYSVYSFDIRGQGLSPHQSCKGHDIGHIERFVDYVTDMQDFVDNVLVKAMADAGEKQAFLLAHSLGGGISAQFLSKAAGRRNPFRAAVLSAPMLDINTGSYPRAVAFSIVAAQTFFGKGDEYAIGKHDYDPNEPFLNNTVTRSEVRFAMAKEVAEKYPQTKIGGPSNGWVYQALKATPKIVANMKHLRTPTMLFQAGDDQIVKLDAQTKGCASTKACRLVMIPGAQHEILMEKDSIREAALVKIDAFFQSHSH